MFLTICWGDAFCQRSPLCWHVTLIVAYARGDEESSRDNCAILAFCTEGKSTENQRTNKYQIIEHIVNIFYCPSRGMGEKPSNMGCEIVFTLSGRSSL